RGRAPSSPRAPPGWGPTPSKRVGPMNIPPRAPRVDPLDPLEPRRLFAAGFNTLAEVGVPFPATASATDLAVDPGGNTFIAGTSNAPLDFNPRRNKTSLAGGSALLPFFARYAPGGGLFFARTLEGLDSDARVDVLALTTDRD